MTYDYEKILITVIIPVYNAERYINRAVDSIINQKISELELVLVDDGSSDDSSNICDEYAKKYDNIQVIHKENGGVCTARNAGLQIAKGKYVSFIDADDYVNINTYSSIIKIINMYQPDCISFGLQYISMSGEITSTIPTIPKNILLDKEYIENIIIPSLLCLIDDKNHFIAEFSCNKVFRLDIIRKYNVLFDETRRIWEDKTFLLDYLRFCKTFYFINQVFYNYVSTPGSLSRQYDLDFFNIILKNYKLYREWYGKKYDFHTTFANRYWCCSIENMIIRSLKQNSNKEIIKNNIKHILQNRQVIEWYQNRIPQNDSEKRINQLVISGKKNKVIKYYEIKMKKEKILNTILILRGKLGKIKNKLKQRGRLFRKTNIHKKQY